MVGLTVMSPSQLSVAVRSTSAGTSVAHSKVRSVGAVGATGAVVSATVIVWLTLEVFPHKSVKVQVRTSVKSFSQAPGVT